MVVIDEIPEFKQMNGRSLGNECYARYGGHMLGGNPNSIYIIKKENKMVNHWSGGHMQGFPDEGPIVDHWENESYEYIIGEVYYTNKSLMAKPRNERFIDDFKRAAQYLYETLGSVTLKTKDISFK